MDEVLGLNRGLTNRGERDIEAPNGGFTTLIHILHNNNVFFVQFVTNFVAQFLNLLVKSSILSQEWSTLSAPRMSVPKHPLL